MPRRSETLLESEGHARARGDEIDLKTLFFRLYKTLRAVPTWKANKAKWKRLKTENFRRNRRCNRRISAIGKRKTTGQIIIEWNYLISVISKSISIMDGRLRDVIRWRVPIIRLFFHYSSHFCQCSQGISDWFRWIILPTEENTFQH